MNDRPPQDRPADKDQIKPFHAKDVSTGQETADVVAAVLKHAAERDVAAQKKTAPKPQPLWMLPMGLTMSVLAAFLLIAPPPWIEMNPIAAQPSEELLADTRAAIVMYGSKIEGYRLSNDGRLPLTLAEAGVEVSGLEYAVQGGEYLLFAEVEGRRVVFNSAVESLRDWAQREVGNLAQAIQG